MGCPVRRGEKNTPTVAHLKRRPWVPYWACQLWRLVSTMRWMPRCGCNNRYPTIDPTLMSQPPLSASTGGAERGATHWVCAIWWWQWCELMSGNAICIVSWVGLRWWASGRQRLSRWWFNSGETGGSRVGLGDEPVEEITPSLWHRLISGIGGGVSNATSCLIEWLWHRLIRGVG